MIHLTKSSLGTNVNTCISCVFQLVHFPPLLWKSLHLEATLRQTYCHVNTCDDSSNRNFCSNLHLMTSLLTDIGNVLCFIYNVQKQTHKLKPINAVGNPNQSSTHRHAGTWQHVCKTRIQTWNPRQNFLENLSTCTTMLGWLLRITGRVQYG
jgi:hypothetical protein